MRELLIGVVVVGAGAAHAEEGPEASVRAQAEPADREGPWLHLDDAVLPPGLEAFDAARDSETTTLELKEVAVNPTIDPKLFEKPAAP